MVSDPEGLTPLQLLAQAPARSWMSCAATRPERARRVIDQARARRGQLVVLDLQLVMAGVLLHRVEILVLGRVWRPRPRGRAGCDSAPSPPPASEGSMAVERSFSIMSRGRRVGAVGGVRRTALFSGRPSIRPSSTAFSSCQELSSLSKERSSQKTMTRPDRGGRICAGRPGASDASRWI